MQSSDLNKLLSHHTSILSSDEYQGRFPGTVGEEKTLDYITDCLEAIGLKSQIQQVPLKKVLCQSKSLMILLSKTSQLIFNDNIDYIVESGEDYQNIQDMEIVFAGYGIVAPEYNWNDYKGLDVKGKLVIALVNDPGLFDNSLFDGDIMTYYGRWAYKYEEAYRQGASGILIVHNEEGAGYPWSVLQSTNTGEHIELNKMDYPKLRGWISETACNKLFHKSYQELCNGVINKQIISHQLKYELHFKIKNNIEELYSANLIAKIEGHISNQTIIYTAHWDHFGTKDNRIYRGARDNALSVSTLMELARKFKNKPKMKRSVIFLFPTAEEQGLLGSKYFTQSEFCSQHQIQGVLNFDVMNIFGATKDISFYGYGKSKLDHLIVKHTNIQGRDVIPDPNPKNGMYYRSDHWPFAQIGIPSLFINMGFKSIDTTKPKNYILNKNNEWTKKCYHKPEDRYVNDPNNEWCWDLSGAVQDLELMYMIGNDILEA